jgi:flagellar assembly protein FliH
LNAEYEALLHSAFSIHHSAFSSMGLIKANDAPSGLRPFSMADIEAAARSILLRARRQAEELIATAQRQGDELKEAARAEGLREGLAKGTADGMRQGSEAGRREAFEKSQKEFAAAVGSLKSVVADIDARRFELEAEALREVVQLAAAIARKVTKRQGLIDERVLAENLTEAMKLAVGAADVRIALHPSQRSTLAEALPQLRTEWPTLKHVELVEDAAVSPGGCRVSTRGGLVDADLDSQLDRVIADLLPAEAPAKGAVM